MYEVMGELKQYIRNNKNQKIGAIVAQKIKKHNHVYVCVVHSKANLKYDKFSENRMVEIIDHRIKYMTGYIFNTKINRRIKSKDKYPHGLTKYYSMMNKRAKQYFKDCDQFCSYIDDLFEYVDFQGEEV